MIEYSLGGAALPADAPAYYKMGEVTALPVPTLKNALFEGWFADADYTRPIKEIPTDAAGIFKVYAKFSVLTVYADYDYAKGAAKLSLQQDGASARSSITLDAANGCLVWDVENGTNKLYKRSTPLISDHANADNTISYTVALSRKPDTPAARSAFQLQVSESATKKNYGNVTLFSVEADGSVKLGGSLLLTTLKSDGTPETFRMVMDFDGADNGKSALLTAYDENGKAIAETVLSLPGGAAARELTSMTEWRKWLTTYQVWWIAWGTGTNTTSLRVHSIYGAEGNLYTAP